MKAPARSLNLEMFLFEFVALHSRLNRVKGFKDYEDETFENCIGMFSCCVDS